MKKLHISNKTILCSALAIYFGLGLVEIIGRVYFTKTQLNKHI